MATTNKLRLEDGRIFMIGQRVKHTKHGYEGVIRKIWVSEHHPMLPRIAIQPDDHQAAKKGCISFPQGEGKEFIESRDSGLPVREWEGVI